MLWVLGSRRAKPGTSHKRLLHHTHPLPHPWTGLAHTVFAGRSAIISSAYTVPVQLIGTAPSSPGTSHLHPSTQHQLGRRVSSVIAKDSSAMAAEIENELHLPEIEMEEEKLPVHDAQTKFRKDYKQPPFWVDTVNLNFNLQEDVTTVQSTLRLLPNYGEASTVPDLALNGRKDVKLVSVKVNGQPHSAYKLSEKELLLQQLPAGTVQLDIVTEIKPQENSLLEGLYKSGGNFCTQCEAEGFRGITYFLDRPDVMAKYTTRIEADKSKYPVLLGNGNLQEEGDLPGGRHFTVWVDPYPKPCYLFALVAGTLSMKERTYTTCSGRNVSLRIFVAEKDLPKVDHALDSLVKSMKWDEETFGLEYDLDLFNIVAVDDFNMGAMENKSLNIFNSRLVLASPETATDTDYARIEGVVGHEYFHNWTGNRVTCRDWFQLTLKEGLTVYRDQEFSADMNSRPVKRIEDVMMLRTSQFSEDAGPMAHPIRPDSYIKMDNFYTVTVYEKGAEVVRLYSTLLGKEGFRKGMDLYFKRHDGHAVTCDDFLAAMADANREDLSRLARWYSQAGTPRVQVEGTYNAAERTYTLKARQSTDGTPNQSVKEPVLIPLAVGLLGKDGQDIPLHLHGSNSSAHANGSTGNGAGANHTAVLRLGEAEQTFVFTDVPEEPVPSVLRNFSAPVRLEVVGQTDEHLLFLFANDSDPFNRWESGQRLLRKLLLRLYDAAKSAGVSSTDKAAVASALSSSGGVPSSLVQAFKAVLTDESVDGAYKAMAVSLPSGTELLDALPGADPTLIHAVRMHVVSQLAAQLRPELQGLLTANDSPPGESYVFNAPASSRRMIKSKALTMLSCLEDPAITGMCLQRFRDASNMTDQISALSALVDVSGPERQIALQEFFERWKHEPLVILKWLGLQAMSNAPGNLALVKSLVSHPAFNINNPNNCYSLFLGFARSPVNFHAVDGSGYEFLADSVLAVDKLNHQVAARMVSAFTTYKQFDESRQQAMRKQLERIVATNGLSENVFEIASKSLA